MGVIVVVAEGVLSVVALLKPLEITVAVILVKARV
jgi:hypothetical protein